MTKSFHASGGGGGQQIIQQHEGLPLRLPCLLANDCRSPRFEPFVTTALPDAIRQGDDQVFEVLARIPMAVCPCKPRELHRDAKRYQQAWTALLMLMAGTVDL